MNIIVVGLNHETAPVEVREKLAFDGPKLKGGLDALCELSEVTEAVILSTCNRVEMYANVKDKERATDEIKDFLEKFHDIKSDDLGRSLYIYNGSTAVQHVFRVASSLNSMVLGEPQILGQVKDAYEFALSQKSTGVVLNKLLKKAISVAKRIRTETKIGAYAVSISYAAVELAKKIFEDLSKSSVMLLGAGDMAELAARHLMNSGAKEVIVSNRTFERGEELAKDFKGRAVRFEDFPSELDRTDIVLCSTGAPEYVLVKDQMAEVMKLRKNKPIFIIDIAVPRNIDPEIGKLGNVFLYDVDNLNEVVDSNLGERKKEAEKAEGIVDIEVDTFRRWQSSLEAVPTVIALRNSAEEIKKQELEKLFNKLDTINDSDKEAIEYMASAIVNKLIHPPTAALRDDIEDRDVLVAMIKRLYGINGEDNEE
ncbi:MAG: glutamyl-tRNA reductase [Nitrospirota bacterium]|nr:MAG: glutamyl-tRNA reductase [Nitrospirota bacterium]